MIITQNKHWGKSKIEKCMQIIRKTHAKPSAIDFALRTLSPHPQAVKSFTFSFSRSSIFWVRAASVPSICFSH